MLNYFTENELNVKIAELNNYLNHFTPKHYLYKKKLQARDYYVGKLIELKENNLKLIQG